jgi:UDP-glucose 4-epimerase
MFHRLYGLPFVALRYFNIFGPRQSCDSPYSGVVARFCRAMLRGETPVIYGDGRQSRDFTYVENVVRANLLAAEAPAARVTGGTFNIACGEGIDLLRLVQDLGRLTGREVTPRFEPARIGDVRCSQADISAAREAFGYSVGVPWLEGLKRTLDWYREVEDLPGGGEPA